MNQTWNHLLLGRIILALTLLLWPATAKGQEEALFKTRAVFRQQLRVPVGITWSDNQLREGLDKLAHTQKVAIFLDRRVDPGQTISLIIEPVPLEELLRRIARAGKLGVGFVGPVVYFGPPGMTARLATLAEKKNESAAELAAPLREKLLARRPWGWSKPAEPRAILRELAAEVELELTNADVVPHDLWRPTQLPPMTFGERMTLVLAGFQMSYLVEAPQRQLSFTTFPKAVTIERRYPVGPRAYQLARELEQEFPQAFIRSDHAALFIRTTLEDHWHLEDRFQRPAEPKRRTRQPTQVYSLTVENQPVGALLNTLARQLSLPLIIEPGAQSLLDRRVSFSVDKATAEELLGAAVGSTGLTARIENSRILVGRSP